MTNPDDPFGQFEDEATKLLDHMTALEEQMVEYKDSALQLGKAHDSLAEIGTQIANHGESITTAGTQAVESMSVAAAALQPLGTAEVKADLQTMQAHFDEARMEIGGRIDVVQAAARDMAEAAARVDAVQERITSAMAEVMEANSSRISARFQEQDMQLAAIATALNANTSRLEGRLAEQDELTLKQAKALAAMIDAIGKRLQAVEAAHHAKSEELLDAVEHSAPIGLLRKKRAK